MLLWIAVLILVHNFCSKLGALPNFHNHFESPFLAVHLIQSPISVLQCAIFSSYWDLILVQFMVPFSSPTLQACWRLIFFGATYNFPGTVCLSVFLPCTPVSEVENTEEIGHLNQPKIHRFSYQTFISTRVKTSPNNQKVLRTLSSPRLQSP